MNKEIQRQMFHLIIGMGAIALLLRYGRGFMVAAVFAIIIVGTLLINARLLGRKLTFIQWFEERFERKNVLFPGWGSACYAAGVLIPLAFLIDVNQIAASIFILAVGDGFSSIVGRMGNIRLFYNRRKTLEGSVAFLLSSLPAYYFVGAVIVPLALLTAVVESITSEVEDNLTIPIACTVFFLVL